MGFGFRVCRQCARGGCAFYFRNRGAPTNRALASARSPAPNHPNYSQLGFRVPPRKAPLKGAFLLLASFRRSTHCTRSSRPAGGRGQGGRGAGGQGAGGRGRGRGAFSGICQPGGTPADPQKSTLFFWRPSLLPHSPGGVTTVLV